MLLQLGIGSGAAATLMHHEPGLTSILQRPAHSLT